MNFKKVETGHLWPGNLSSNKNNLMREEFESKRDAAIRLRHYNEINVFQRADDQSRLAAPKLADIII